MDDGGFSVITGTIPGKDSASPSPGPGVPRQGRPGRWRAVIGAATYAGPPAALAFLGWQRRWFADDGLIVARVVRQILAGNGPVFNQGERVEATTSALWTWLIAGLSWVTRADVYAVLLGTGLVLAPLGLLLAMLGARRLHRRSGAAGPLLPVGAIVVLALPPFWDFVTSGLEEPLTLCWLALCWYQFTGVRTAPSRRDYLLAGTVGLGWLVWPPSALFTLSFLGAVFAVQRPRFRRAAALLAAAGAVPLGYQVFRMGYYGLLVPNTAVAKEAGQLRLDFGLHYLASYVRPFWLWVPVIALLLMAPVLIGEAWRDGVGRSAVIAVAAGALAVTGYVTAIGGDFMNARMLLPGTFALLLPVMVAPVRWPAMVRRPRPGAVAAGIGCTVLAAWALVCGVALRAPLWAPLMVGNERLFWMQALGARYPVDPGRFAAVAARSPADPASISSRMAEAIAAGRPELVLGFPVDRAWPGLPLSSPGASIAVSYSALGSLGVLVPLHGIAVDVRGLSYALGSHLRLMPGRRVGEGKYVRPAWIIASYSTAKSEAGVPGAAIAAARRALRCGLIAELRQATQAPLTRSRLVDNVTGSLALTTFRIPENPVAAEHAFCRR